MIKKHSDDPDVEAAANHAFAIITEVLGQLPKADSFDYGGQQLKIGEYDVCTICTTSIAEAQQAQQALLAKAEELDDPVVQEHLQLAASMFEKEANVATLRAELHNGHGTEKILNTLLGFIHDRAIPDTYQHSHHQGA